MKTLVVLTFLSTAAVAQTNDLQFSKRFVNGVTVDLTPLVKWVGNSTNARPLKAWKKISGIKVADIAQGWLVQVEADGTVKKAILRNPPAAEWRDFLEKKTQRDLLVAELKGYERSKQDTLNDLVATARNVR